MKCVILAAGYATRLYPLTENFPKPLLEINGKTILDWLVDDIDTSPYVDEYIVVSNHKFINYFNDWKDNKLTSKKITVIDDGTVDNDNRLGAVSDINLAISKLNLNDDLLVVAGDNVLDFSLNNFIDYFYEKKESCIMRYYEADKEKIKKSAAVNFDNNDLVLEMVEKPNNPNSNWCVPPFYIYTKEDASKVETALKNGCNKDAPGSFINWLYDKSSVYAMEMPGKRYDIGNLDSYKEVNQNYSGIKSDKKLKRI